MKSKSKVIFILLVLLTILIVSVSFGAESNDVGVEVDDIIEDIDSTKIEEFYSLLGDVRYNFGTSFKEVVNGIADGKVYDFDTFLDVLVEAFNNSLTDELHIFVFIIAIIILTAVTHSFSYISIDGVGSAASMLSYASIAATVLSMIVACVSTVTSVLGNISGLINALFPVILTLTSALGGVSTGGVLESMGIVASTTIVNIIKNVVLPLFGISMIFTLIGNLYGRIQLNNVSKLAKSLSEWLLGIVFSLFVIVLGGQGIIGNTVDTVAFRSAKFAMSTYVPVLGGYLSDGFDIVLAGCLIVKNSVGFVGILIVLLVVVAPCIKIFVISILLKVLGSVAEPLGLGNISTMLFKSGENLRVLIAILLGVGFVVIAMLVMVITLFNQGVV